MTRAVLVALGLLALATVARAHIGSPNVFFDGRAGEHGLRVVIRPPATLPGVAQVDVRVTDADVRAVAVRPRFMDGGAGTAPEAVAASRVDADAGLYTASVWLLRRGSYGVEIELESARGGGRVSVPLQAAVLARPVMPPALGGLLLALGALLCGSALWIAAAVAGPRRAGRALGVVGVLLAAGVWGGRLRWQALDAGFANALYQPVPVAAEVAAEGGMQRLRLQPDGAGAPGQSWDTLVTDHGKLMHLFLIREPGLDAFAHLHPVRRHAGLFEGVAPPLPGGKYALYAELTHESGATETLVSRIELPDGLGPVAQAPGSAWADIWCLSPFLLPNDSSQPSALDSDDSWHAGASSGASEALLMGGGRMRFASDAALVVDRETSLRFRVEQAGGEAAPLEPYMGMLGHAVVRHTDGGVFTHLHPVGTVSMAAAELLALREGTTSPMATPVATGETEVVFPYAFPRAGPYRVWVQVRPRGGGVVTGVFDLSVSGG